MTKVEALKKLFETLGGDPDEVVNETQIAEMPILMKSAISRTR